MQLLPLQQTLQLLPLDEAWGLQSGEGRFHAAAVRMAGHTEPFYQWSVNRVTMSQTPQAAPAKIAESPGSKNLLDGRVAGRVVGLYFGELESA
ncbi:hypothetical protein U9M48_040818 [Paspalum notatum var. saurae]|uniref:Uncharacterized protein n=1 Tax=Paspalum notatum var. saurae TaxID=547442 RepID=A0AAQ3UP84_PASNO